MRTSNAAARTYVIITPSLDRGVEKGTVGLVRSSGSSIRSAISTSQEVYTTHTTKPRRGGGEDWKPLPPMATLHRIGYGPSRKSSVGKSLMTVSGNIHNSFACGARGFRTREVAELPLFGKPAECLRRYVKEVGHHRHASSTTWSLSLHVWRPNLHYSAKFGSWGSQGDSLMTTWTAQVQDPSELLGQGASDRW
jgi:hypothetical protein